MFYAVLPVFDASLSGKDHLEMWDGIHVKYQTLLLNYIFKEFDKLFHIQFVDPYWFGIDNSKLLQSVSKPKKMKAYYNEPDMIMNWTVGGRKVNLTIHNTEEFRQEGNTWYCCRTSVTFEEGHVKETNEWKEYTFVYEPKDE